MEYFVDIFFFCTYNNQWEIFLIFSYSVPIMYNNQWDTLLHLGPLYIIYLMEIPEIKVTSSFYKYKPLIVILSLEWNNSILEISLSHSVPSIQHITSD